jgi:hypothetical protein
VRLHFEDGERELLIARLQLDERADDAAIATAVATWIQEDPTANTENNNTDDDVNAQNNTDDIDENDSDVVVVDVSEFRRLRARDRVAGQIEAANAIRDRDELIEEAIHDGKFSPARREHYKARYDSDAEGTRKLIAAMAKHTVPLEARGVDVPTDDVDDLAYPKEWVPEVAARQGRSGSDERPRNRVHGES